MKSKNQYCWQAIAQSFLDDDRMINSYCIKEAQCLMMSLGSKISGEPGFIYFLTHRERLLELSRYQAGFEYKISYSVISNWFRGFGLLAAWRLGYRSIEANNLLARLFSYDDFEYYAKNDFEKNIGNHYHIHMLKKEQKDALQSQDIARLRLYVDLAPEPGRKLKQLLCLAVKLELKKAAAALLGWLPEHPELIEDDCLLPLLKVLMLPSESDNGLQEKLNNPEQYPLLKNLLDNKTFKENWFQWLMQNGLLTSSVMKKMLDMGMPTNIVINHNTYLSGDYNSLHQLFKDYDHDLSVCETMHLFQEMKPCILPIIRRKNLCHGKSVEKLTLGFSPSASDMYKLILLYCELADAFAEWENEKS